MKNFISYLIYDLNWLWLQYLISLICEIEVQFKLLLHSDFRDFVNSSDTIPKYPIDKGDKSSAQLTIPKNTLYCEDCKFHCYSKMAKLLLGEQSSGYCYYLGKGDFSFIKPTLLLWDECKECGINEDIWEEEDEETNN